MLRADPGTETAASAEGWEYPFPRELAAAADLWDLQYAKTGVKRPMRYPRPVKPTEDKIRRGDAAGRSPAEVAALLRPPV